ncbi:sulfite exporter TauE/SafE family protein [Neptuniibacter caesariensis]|uniref:Probable membrane transporter protein n=1 Tax=Neptuniibacter caesariensis TaxID=207954 RepID=A0A7U8C2X0_NEPCE|nr:sulfite exporter TauE/SafE family protein [Neptuniibacter caesariensis]EAR60513.1 hypothetical protein MED92_16655 [Oceanospirillum sp. MED92] [Neptuniibacter caesariensis]
MIGLEWAPLIGALIGTVVGFTGVGGGALMAPILLLGFGLELTAVVATDLLFAAVTKLASSTVHNKNKLIDWQVSKRMWLGSIPASLLTLSLVSYGIIESNSEWIIKLLGGLIFMSGISILFGSKLQLFQRTQRIQAPDQFKKMQAPTTTLSGALLGTLVTLTSIGAGALGAVILRSLYPLRMNTQKLVATDTIHAIPVSLIAGAGYLLLGHVNIEILILMLSGSIPGAIFSSNIIKKVSPHIIKKGLALALIAASLKMMSE